MRLRNDTDGPLFLTTDPALVVAPGETVERDTYVAGLTPVDAEFVDGEWQPKPATKTRTRKGADDDAEEATK